MREGKREGNGGRKKRKELKERKRNLCGDMSNRHFQILVQKSFRGGGCVFLSLNVVNELNRFVERELVISGGEEGKRRKKGVRKGKERRRGEKEREKPHIDGAVARVETI